jgi:hypothetical protein
MPFSRLSAGGYRLTVVYYAMEPLKMCGTASQELQRIQKLKTTRTQKRAFALGMLKTLDLKQMPVCPVFIPSRGRARFASTPRALKGAKVPFTLVVEPQEAESYRALWPDSRVLVLPENNRGVTYVRQFILDHARQHGIVRYWQIDDNIPQWFVKLQGQMQIVPPNYVLREMEKDAEREPRLALLATDYQQFAALASKDATQNTRTYCCVLTRSDTGIDYRPEVEMKEDVDFCMQHVARGWQTRLFHKFAMAKPPMGKTKSGGLVDKYKLGKDSEAARRLCRLWPEVATLIQKGERWDAKINWAALSASAENVSSVA